MDRCLKCSSTSEGCGVEVDTDRIHATHHRIVEGVFQTGMIHIVLILPDTNRFRIDFYKFGQGVDEPSAYRYGSPYGHVLVRKFLACYIGGGIYQAPFSLTIFTASRGIIPSLRRNSPVSARCSAAAQSYGFYFVDTDQASQGTSRSCNVGARRSGVYYSVVEQASVAVEAYDLHPVRNPGSMASTASSS